MYSCGNACVAFSGDRNIQEKICVNTRRKPCERCEKSADHEHGTFLSLKHWKGYYSKNRRSFFFQTVWNIKIALPLWWNAIFCWNHGPVTNPPGYLCIYIYIHMYIYIYIYIVYQILKCNIYLIYIYKLILTFQTPLFHWLLLELPLLPQGF